MRRSDDQPKKPQPEPEPEPEPELEPEPEPEAEPAPPPTIPAKPLYRAGQNLVCVGRAVLRRECALDSAHEGFIPVGQGITVLERCGTTPSCFARA